MTENLGRELMLGTRHSTQLFYANYGADQLICFGWLSVELIWLKNPIYMEIRVTVANEQFATLWLSTSKVLIFVWALWIEHDVVEDLVGSVLNCLRDAH